MIVQKIFERAGEHPEVIPDLKKMMDYYLPMTVKLLDAYEDMDGQPVQGENITASKKEIEETIDTLNIAFEKLLDSIFRIPHGMYPPIFLCCIRFWHRKG